MIWQYFLNCLSARATPIITNQNRAKQVIMITHFATSQINVASDRVIDFPNKRKKDRENLSIHFRIVKNFPLAIKSQNFHLHNNPK